MEFPFALLQAIYEYLTYKVNINNMIRPTQLNRTTPFMYIDTFEYILHRNKLVHLLEKVVEKILFNMSISMKYNMHELKCSCKLNYCMMLQHFKLICTSMVLALHLHHSAHSIGVAGSQVGQALARWTNILSYHNT